MRTLSKFTLCAWAATLLVGCAAVPPVDMQVPGSRLPVPAEDDLRTRVQHALPHGWAIVEMARRRVPPGWNSSQARGTIATVSDGTNAWPLTFVPLDWIGIQTRSREEQEQTLPDWVMQSESYKLIRDRDLHEKPAG